MEKLEKLLKAAKPAVPDLPLGFSERVMSEIEMIDLATVPIKPIRQSISWIQLAGSLLFSVLALLIVNYIVFEIQMNGTVELLYFGTQFLKDVFAYIPFDLIIPAIAVSGVASWLMWNSRALKRGIASVVIGTYLTTAFGGVVLAATGVNEKIQAALINEKKDLPLVSWLFKERARYFIEHPHFKMGRVEVSDGQFVWIVDPHGHKSKIELPAGMQVQKGQIIRMAGETSGDHFRVRIGHHCNPVRVARYFHFQSKVSMSGDEESGRHHMMQKKTCCTFSN